MEPDRGNPAAFTLAGDCDGTLLLDVGATPWPVLTCRDRTQVALDAELAALAAIGVPGVHCVTGDAAHLGTLRAGLGVFEVDGPRLAAMASARGLPVSVAATPVAPPIEMRPHRLVEKERAGASLCIINHAGGPDAVRRFTAAGRAAGSTLAFIACVAVFTDERSAAVLANFPGTALDPSVVAEVLGAADPVEAGIDAAVQEAIDLLRSGAVAGVDLSGSATAGDETHSAEILAEVARRVRACIESHP